MAVERKDSLRTKTKVEESSISKTQSEEGGGLFHRGP